MRRRIIILSSLIVILVVSLNVHAQDSSAELDRITDALVNAVQEELPGWSHKVIAPMEGSRDVSIIQWASGNKAVSVTLVGHASDAEARQRVKEFVADLKADEQLADTGDEGYSWSTSAALIFRRGRVTVNVQVRGDDLKDEKRMSKQFARLAAAAISAP